MASRSSATRYALFLTRVSVALPRMGRVWLIAVTAPQSCALSRSPLGPGLAAPAYGAIVVNCYGTSAKVEGRHAAQRPCLGGLEWRARRGSNPRPSDPKYADRGVAPCCRVLLRSIRPENLGRCSRVVRWVTTRVAKHGTRMAPGWRVRITRCISTSQTNVEGTD